MSDQSKLGLGKLITTELQQNSDRAETIFTGSIPDGEYNREMRVEATECGLEIDYGVTIPWEWIDAARRAHLLS